jgi:hypothetical protein
MDRLCEVGRETQANKFTFGLGRVQNVRLLRKVARLLYAKCASEKSRVHCRVSLDFQRVSQTFVSPFVIEQNGREEKGRDTFEHLLDKFDKTHRDNS